MVSPAQSYVELGIDVDGIATVSLNTPAKSVNTLSPAMFVALGDAFNRIEREGARGVIIASAKPGTFVAGADLFELARMERDGLEEFMDAGQRVFNQLADLGVPTVAAVAGDCLGGGLELALACRGRIAAADETIQIAAPEVKLGLVPGWGGTVRLVQVIGLESALPLLLSGKAISPREALRLGLVDAVVEGEELLDAAGRVVRAGPLLHRRAPRPADPGAILAKTMRDMLQKTRGRYPAPRRLIDVVREGVEKGPAAGMEAEKRALVDLAGGEVGRNLLRLFFLRQGARKAAYACAGGAMPRSIQSAAVIGGGTMGAGIAYCLAAAGIEVRLIEVDDEAIAGGMSRIQTYLNAELAGGRLSKEQARELVRRIGRATDWAGIDSAEIVVEAVPEDMRLKREIFARLGSTARADAILASNTSALDIGEMTRSVSDPSRVLGMHFMNPVPRMPLVEIVRTGQTSGEALATAVRLVQRLGKTPVVVWNAPGFVMNRVLMPYLAEAIRLAHEGAGIERIDAAMEEWGWPMGPMRLMDEIGLDVTAAIMGVLVGAFPDRFTWPGLLDRALAGGWRGRKSGGGFYLYDREGRELNLDVIAMLPQRRDGPASANEIQRRLLAPMIGEAVRVLDEGVVESADSLDLAMVLGLGFPPFRGGLMRFAEKAGLGEAASAPISPAALG